MVVSWTSQSNKEKKKKKKIIVAALRRLTQLLASFSVTSLFGSSCLAWEKSASAQRLMAGFSLVCAVLLCSFVANAKPTLRKERVIYHDPELSRQAHEDGKSHQYDHEVFLGKEEAKTFDQLTPEESKDRLRWDPLRSSWALCYDSFPLNEWCGYKYPQWLKVNFYMSTPWG